MKLHIKVKPNFIQLYYTENKNKHDIMNKSRTPKSEKLDKKTSTYVNLAIVIMLTENFYKF